jgi:hypothetical protein
MAGVRPVATYTWDRGVVTLSKSGIVRLDGTRIGRVLQLNPSTFGARSSASGHELGLPLRPPPETLRDAVAAVYSAWVTQVLDREGDQS